MNQTILIQFTNRLYHVEANVQDGLAIHGFPLWKNNDGTIELSDYTFSITHIATGCRLCEVAGASDALTVRDELLSLMNWQCSNPKLQPGWPLARQLCREHR